MDSKTLQLIEFPKVLEQLARYASFSVSADLARQLSPTSELNEALQRQKLTSEARLLLSTNDDISIGGARDIRSPVDFANHGGTLMPAELLEVQNTLESARTLGRKFARAAEQVPGLAEIAATLIVPGGLIEAIHNAISERGDILDSASPKLGTLRSQIKVVRDRLFARLGRYLSDPETTGVLQDNLITQRNGRYVIPLRAEYKGRIKAIVHDQSASGATLFVEPLALVDMNNELIELELAAKNEELRILAELSARIGENAGAILGLVDTIARIDLYLMSAKYADDLRASEPVLKPFRNLTDTHPGSTLRLRKARHPLLDPSRVVPLDIVLDDKTFAVVITGPNTGGKTVSLKTVGLMIAMAQSGLHLPAESGSELSLFQNLYADIGDEQSIEQSLSTFSGHITNIIRILRQAGPQSLVLLDELGAGTDPQEGGSLARAILAYLLRNRIPCLVATHFPELKTFAHLHQGVVNASMEFDIQTLRPTYRLNLGLPGRSNGLLISERLGMFPEIIAEAKSEINPDDLRSDGLLDQIYLQRDLESQARQKAERANREAEKLQRELNSRLAKIEEERLSILDEARQQAEDELDDMRAQLRSARRLLERAHQPVEEIAEEQEQVEKLQTKYKKPARRRNTHSGKSGPLKVGEKVFIHNLRVEGTIVSIAGETADVQAGALRLKTRLDELQRPAEMAEPETPVKPTHRQKALAAFANSPAPSAASGIMRPSPGLDVDLRGQRVEDALDQLERHIESAFLSGLPMLRVIHGKGTGRLREVIRQQAKGMAHISGWEPALDNEGGEGVTILRLKY